MRADYPRVTHPCATLLETEASFAFDLHVLSTPPAFNLSQNQTLQFKSVSRFLLGRNQNLKDSFFPLAIHLSMNHPRASAPCRSSQRRGADLCTIPLAVSTTFFVPAKFFFAVPRKAQKSVVQSREVEDIHPPLICQRFFVKKLPGCPEYHRKATHGNALRKTILSPGSLPMAYRAAPYILSLDQVTLSSSSESPEFALSPTPLLHAECAPKYFVIWRNMLDIQIHPSYISL